MKYIHRCLGVLAGLGVLFAVTLSAPSAFATLPPPEPGAAAPVVIHTGGMPGWQIILIAVGAALCAAVVAVLLDRARAARRQLASTTS